MLAFCTFISLKNQNIRCIVVHTQIFHLLAAFMIETSCLANYYICLNRLNVKTDSTHTNTDTDREEPEAGDFSRSLFNKLINAMKSCRRR